MKKIKLLLAAMAAMVTMGVNAQTWTGNEVAAGTFYLYNVGTGQWLCAANDWGTHASIGSVGLDYTLAGADGVYTIDSNVSNGGNNHYLVGDWNDGGATQFTFNKVADSPITYTIQNGDNYLGYTGNGTYAGMVSTVDENAQWILVTKNDILAKMAQATALVPMNVTMLIADANFGRNDLRKSYWTMVAGNQNLSGGNNVNNCAESWHSTFTLSQAIENLPKGVYGLKAQGFYRQDGSDNDNLPVFYINDATTPFIAREDGGPNSMSACSESFAAGNYTTAEALYRYDEGDFIVGAKLETNTTLWCIWDNFQLTYYGDCTVQEALFGSLIKELKEVIASAKSNASTLVIPSTASANLLALAEAKEEAMESFTTEEQYNEAITALNDAIEGAKALVTPLHWYNLAKERAVTTVNLEALAAENQSTLRTVVANSENAIETCTTVDAIEAQTAALWAGIADAIESIEVEGDNALDLTYLLVNPDLTNCPGWAKADGWYNDQNQPVQNSQVMNTNQAAAYEKDPTKYAYYEYWSNSTEATAGFTVYQKVYLPEGTYKMTALAYAGYGGGHRYGIGTDDGGKAGSVSSVDNKNITFSAGDVDGSPITTTKLDDASIDFIQETEGEVKIGLKAHEGNTSNWMGIGYVQLFKVATKEPVVIAEDADYTPESAAADVTLKRTFTADSWNTFVVPFQITNAELTEAFGANVAVAEFSETVEGLESTATFTTMETPAIMANRPVLIKVDTDATEFEFKGRTVAGGDFFTPGVNFKFQGTYAATTTIPEKDYFISADKLYRSTGATTIKGTRAYLADQTGGAAEVKLFIDGLATRLSEINGAAENGVIYNIAGQRVNKAQKGIFIVDGKKVVK